VSTVRANLYSENWVVKTKVQIQILVCNDLKIDACKGDAGSFWAPMRETRKTILTDARRGPLGNGGVQGMGQIPDARNLHPGGNHGKISQNPCDRDISSA